MSATTSNREQINEALHDEEHQVRREKLQHYCTGITMCGICIGCVMLAFYVITSIYWIVMYSNTSNTNAIYDFERNSIRLLTQRQRILSSSSQFTCAIVDDAPSALFGSGIDVLAIATNVPGLFSWMIDPQLTDTGGISNIIRQSEHVDVRPCCACMQTHKSIDPLLAIDAEIYLRRQFTIEYTPIHEILSYKPERVQEQFDMQQLDGVARRTAACIYINTIWIREGLIHNDAMEGLCGKGCDGRSIHDACKDI